MPVVALENVDDDATFGILVVRSYEAFSQIHPVMSSGQSQSDGIVDALA